MTELIELTGVPLAITATEESALTLRTAAVLDVGTRFAFGATVFLLETGAASFTTGLDLAVGAAFFERGAFFRSGFVAAGFCFAFLASGLRTAGFFDGAFFFPEALAFTTVFFFNPACVF
ncbi:MAG TPA: hypothetical protein PLB55_07185, partial [Prosthecobacter sp.]|nr:hypothetical protein [Prosthecobacter sp.]